MKKPDSLIFIAVWEFITAFVAFIGLFAVAFIIAFPAAMWGSALPAAIFGLSIAILVLICFIGIAIAGGIGLLKGREWGRVLSIIHSAPLLLSFPIGTVPSVIIIMYLMRADVKGYFQAGDGGEE